jgi:hypothetical protein
MAAITFNGEEYTSVEAMPPDVRQLYELALSMTHDGNQDGVPDLLAQGLPGDATVIRTQQFVVDGVAYGSIDEMPPEVRERYQAGIGRFDRDGDGAPDFFAGLFAAGDSQDTPATPTATPPDPVREVGEAPPNPAAIWIMLGFVVAAIVAVAIVLYVMR